MTVGVRTPLMPVLARCQGWTPYGPDVNGRLGVETITPLHHSIPKDARFDPAYLYWGGLADRWDERVRTIDVDLSPVGIMRASGMEPDDWQRVLLSSVATRLYGLCSRQVGKSQCMAVKCLGWSMPPDQTTIVASPSFRQSARILARARVVWRRVTVAYDGADIPKITNRAIDRIEFDNGSQILALPASAETIRGETANNGLIDEASFCPKLIRDVISPMLASTNGQLAAISSAGITGHWFESEWNDKDRPGAEFVTVKWSDVPRISEEFIRNERRSMTQARFDQEYCNVFGQATGSMFLSADIGKLVVPEVQGLVVPAADWS
jgi:hypothetical protein